MKNQPLAKLNPSSYANDRLQYLQHRSFQKSDYASLNKYNRSPYLQKITQQIQLRKKNTYGEIDSRGNNEASITSFKNRTDIQVNAPHFRSFSNNSNYQLPKTDNMTISPNKKVPAFKLPKIDRQDSPAFQSILQIKQIEQTAQSATLQFSSTKKKKLDPLRHQAFKCVIKTKAGTNGKQAKINQDCAFIDQKLPFGLKCYCVCDGHGLNGHLVSSYIKTHMIKNLISALKKQTSQPQYDKMQEIILNVFSKTNQSLLDCEINTQLSGSTVVAVFQYKNKIFCFNVGDSRAILCSQLENNLTINQEKQIQNGEVQLIDSSQKQLIKQGKEVNSLIKIKLSKSHKLQKHIWRVLPLSNDQKPERQDERQRVIRNGGRIECNKTQKGEQIGPLRVWMKEIQMPGLAMTRSFGDKAGLRAGTSGQAQVTQHEIIGEDKFIIIASDGVWEYLENQEVMNTIIPFYMRDDIDMGAQKLVKLSTQIWGRVSLSRDDITVIILQLNPPKQ